MIRLWKERFEADSMEIRGLKCLLNVHEDRWDANMEFRGEACSVNVGIVSYNGI
jgi:hypothetical protein